jgi:hypothetical protein
VRVLIRNRIEVAAQAACNLAASIESLRRQRLANEPIASRGDRNHKGDPRELLFISGFGRATKSPLAVISGTASTVNQREHMK